MKSLILVTFGALGWSWYAMSGGADFEPGNRHVNLPGLQVETAQAATPEVARADTGGSCPRSTVSSTGPFGDRKCWNH